MAPAHQQLRTAKGWRARRANIRRPPGEHGGGLRIASIATTRKAELTATTDRAKGRDREEIYAETLRR
jgi:hypothetical protein